MEQLRFPLTPKEAEAEGIKSISQLNRSALFPTRLRELRNEKGIPQTEFAKELGVTKSTISLYETGDNVPDIKTLYKMAHFFNVSFDYLLGDSDFRQSENENIAAADLKLSENAIERLHFYASNTTPNTEFLDALNALIECNQPIVRWVWEFASTIAASDLSENPAYPIWIDGKPLKKESSIAVGTQYEVGPKEVYEQVMLSRIERAIRNIAEDIKFESGGK